MNNNNNNNNSNKIEFDKTFYERNIYISLVIGFCYS